MAAGFLREVIRAYHSRHPDVALRVLEGASVEQIALVRKSRLDVAFVLGTPDVPNCDVAQLWTEHMFVALPQEHILCETMRSHGRHFAMSNSSCANLRKAVLSMTT
jgi:DNA-binding transcriptional LysR family regulator